MALKTIFVAADGTHKALNLKANEMLALDPDGKLIVPWGLKRKELDASSETAQEGGPDGEQVVFVDENGASYTVFVPAGAEVLVAQAGDAGDYREFPTNPAGAGSAAGSAGGSPQTVPTLPVNPNSPPGPAPGGGITAGGATMAVVGGIAGIGLIAAVSDDSSSSRSGGGEPDPNNAAPRITSNGGNASAAVSVAENNTAVTTIIATDPDGDTLSYSILGGDDATRFTIGSGSGMLSFIGAPDFETPDDADGNNIYQVVVQVSDGNGGVDTQTLNVSVLDLDDEPDPDPNNAPVIISNGGNPISVTVGENTPFSTTIMAQDPDGDTVVLTLTGPDAALFSLDPGTGLLSLPGQDFDTPADAGADNSYNVTVVASDGDLSDTQTITVTVAGADEANTAIAGVLAGSVTEVTSEDPGNPTAQGQMTAIDPDGPDNLFVVTNGMAQFGTFSVSAAGLWTYNLDSSNPTVSVLNTGQSLADSFTVTAADGTVATVSIVVNGQNGVIDPTPNTTIGGDLMGAVIEAGSDNNNGTPTDSGQLTAMNPDGPDDSFRPVGGGSATYGSFTVSATGVWTYTLDNDDPTVNGVAQGDTLADSFTVTSIDGSTGTVAVTITGANDAPVVDATQMVTTVEDQQIMVTVPGVDPDGDVLSYSAALSEEGQQLIGGQNGVFTYTPPVNFVGEDRFVVTVTDGVQSTQQTVIVTISEVNDDAPVIISNGGGNEGSVQIIENTVAVTTVQAEDEDTGAVITYSITGGAQETYFRIDQGSGVLEFWAPPSAEQGQGQGLLSNRYEVIVTATDDTGLTDSQTLLVDVQNDGLLGEIGELPPRFTSGAGLDEAQYEIPENTLFVAQLNANGGQLLNLDGNNDTLVFRIAGGDDAELFRIQQIEPAPNGPNTGSATLSFLDAFQPDFEMPGSSNGDNEYDLIVQTSDDDGVDFQRLTITVLDVNAIDVVDDVNALSEAGGVANTRDVETTSGNVLTNDTDEADAVLSVASANAIGDAPTAVTDNGMPGGGTTIQGDYGSLLIRPDGSYTYTPDQALIDAVDIDPSTAGVQSINTGNTLVDTFIYEATNDDAGDALRVPGQLDITINGTNDAPVVDLNGGANGIDFVPSAFTEGGAAVLVTANTSTVMDVDNPRLVSATLTLRGPNGELPDVQDESLAVNQNLAAFTSGRMTAAYDRDTGVLTLTGFNATLADFQSVIRSLTYENLGDNVTPGSTRVVTVTLFDGQDASPPAVSNIPLIGFPDAPVAMDDTNLATASQSADPLVEAGVNGETPVAGDAIAVGNVLANDVDPDTDDITGLEITAIETGATLGAGTAGTVGGPVLQGIYGALLIESDGSYTYTLDNARAATQALAAGQVVTESFTYEVTDPDDLTDTAVLTLTITGTNDRPVLDLNGVNVNGINFNSATFREGTDDMDLIPIVDSGALTVADPDNTRLASALVTLTAPSGLPDPDAERLVFNNLLAPVTAGRIVGQYNPDSGVLTFTGFNATVADFQLVLRSVSYQNDGDSVVPGPIRTATFVINDGTSNNAPAAVSTITLIGEPDAPIANADSNLAAPVDLVSESGVNPGNTAFPGDATATGNVIANDVDPDNAPGMATAGLSVTAIRTVPEGGGGQAGFVGGVALVGTYGSLSMAANGTWTYTLNNADADTQALDQDETATDVFRYTVSDPQGNTGTALLTVSITGTNDTPVAVVNTRTMSEGGAPLTGAGANNVLVNDVDPDGMAANGDPLVLSVSQVNGVAGNVGVGVAGTYGTLNMAATGNYTYTLGAAAEALDQGEVVTETFTYNAMDDFGAESGPANLTITITGVADPTVFAAATRTVNVGENQTTVTTVVATDADMEPLTYTIIGGADQGFFNLDPMTGALTFIAPRDFETPQDAGANNGYVVQVSADDLTDTLGAVTQTITVNVQNVNEAPTVANLLLDQGVDIGEQLNYQFPNLGTVGAIFADQDAGDMLTYTAALAGGGALPAFLSFNAATRTFTGTPTQAEAGMNFDIVVTATDTGGLTAADTFRIGVGANNPPTVAMPLLDQMATENQQFSFQFAANTFADQDAGDQASLVYTARLANGDPLPAWLLFDPLARTFIGTPGPGDVQDLMIRVIATDPGGLSISDVFNLAVANVNDPVMAVNDTNLAFEAGVDDPGTPTAIGQAGLDGVLDNDLDPDLNNDPNPDVLVVNRVTVGGMSTAVPAGGNVTVMGTYGSLTLESDGSYTYTLDNGDPDTQMLAQNTTADEVFTYRVSDGNGSQDTATLTITVAGANDAPEVTDLTTTNNSFSFTATDVDSAAAITTLYTGSLTLPNPLANDGNPTTQAVTAQAAQTDAIYRVSDGIAADVPVARLILGTATAAAGMGAFDETLDATASAVGSILYGFGGQDSLLGSPQDDFLYGNAGDDRLRGGAGDDLIHGGAGNNNVAGGPGNDTIDVSAGNDTIVYEANALTGNGQDTVTGFDGDTAGGGQDMFDLVALLETLTGDNASDFSVVDNGGGMFELRVDTTNDGMFDYLLATVQVAMGSTFGANDVIAA